MSTISVDSSIMYNKKYIDFINKLSLKPDATAPKKHFQRHEDPLMREFETVVNLVKVILSSEKSIQENIETSFSPIFDLRLKFMMQTMIHQGKESHVNLKEVYQLMSKDVEELVKDKAWAEFGENLMFAIRSSQKAHDIAINKIKTQQNQGNTRKIDPIVPSNYNQFISTLYATVPNQEFLQVFIDWINSSLIIEFCVLTMLIVKDEKIKVKKDNIKELSFLISDAGQTYLGCVLNNDIPKVSGKIKNLTEADKEKEIELADLGLEDVLTFR